VRLSSGVLQEDIFTTDKTYSLSTLETIVADFGDNLSPKTATVAKSGL